MLLSGLTEIAIERSDIEELWLPPTLRGRMIALSDAEMFKSRTSSLAGTNTPIRCSRRRHDTK